jgi:hypothetical protein
MAEFKKVKVKFLDSIACLADPKPRAVLDAKYDAIINELKNREKPPSSATIKNQIDEKKRADRYGEPMLGFTRDMAWKSGEEAFINAELAEKWQDCGTCLIIEEPASKKAA